MTTMTALEFRALLRLHGMRQRALAERLGVDVGTVNHWAVGERPVPRYATAYLELLGRLQLIALGSRRAARRDCRRASLGGAEASAGI